MVIPGYTIGFQVLSIVGITIPIFILSIEAFNDENEVTGEDMVMASVTILVSSGITALIGLLLPPGEFVNIRNVFLDASAVLLGFGYIGLGITVYDLLNIDLRKLDQNALYLLLIGFSVTGIVAIVSWI